jgi:hypothetical protein
MKNRLRIHLPFLKKINFLLCFQYQEVVDLLEDGHLLEGGDLHFY